jgi:very-short-patch-repair endonuclease
MPHRSVSDLQRGNARRLRREMTDAECKLWYAVRAKRFENLGFRRQVPIGPFIVDFFCPEHRLIVELDGGQHGTDEALRYDAERTDWLAANGYRVMRFWNTDVLTNLDGVLSVILEAVDYGATMPAVEKVP